MIFISNLLEPTLCMRANIIGNITMVSLRLALEYKENEWTEVVVLVEEIISM